MMTKVDRVEDGCQCEPDEPFCACMTFFVVHAATDAPTDAQLDESMLPFDALGHVAGGGIR